MTWNVLHVGTKAFLPGELTLTINEHDKEKLKEFFCRIYLLESMSNQPLWKNPVIGWLKIFLWRINNFH